MAYVLVENFAGGVDDRKSPITAPPGTLLYCNNAHLSAGGEIEKRKAFVPLYPFPPDAPCIGLGGDQGDQLYCYGRGPRPSTLYSDFEWIDARTGGLTPTRVLRSQWWEDKPLTLIEYSNGETRLWHGATVVDWTTAWDLTLPTGKLRDILVLDTKTYGVQDSFLAFSGVAAFDKWGSVGSAVGSGFLDASQQGPLASKLRTIALYQNRAAVFSRRAALIYGLDPDPDLTTLLQYLPNFGCIAPRSVQGLGESDTLLLSHSGIRSLRARDSSNLATYTDIGSPINRTVTAHARLLADADGMVPGIGAFEAFEQRYWLALGDVIYVLSYYPATRVSGWTTYTPGFNVDDIASVGDDLFVLGENFLYSYGRYAIKDRGIGALASSDYDATTVEVVLPYIDGAAPATVKQWTGVDAGIEGDWTLDANMNVRAGDAYERLAKVTATTFDVPPQEVVGESTHIKLRMTSDFDGFAALRNVVVHYETKEAG